MNLEPLAPSSFSRIFIRVPRTEWLEVKHGRKKEFRRGSLSKPAQYAELPTPVIGYAANTDKALFVLTSVKQEPLGGITPEGIKAEGCETFDEFKWKWSANREARFDPLRKVWVIRMHPFTEKDLEEWPQKLFNRLFPEDLSGL